MSEATTPGRVSTLRDLIGPGYQCAPDAPRSDRNVKCFAENSSLFDADVRNFYAPNEGFVRVRSAMKRPFTDPRA